VTPVSQRARRTLWSPGGPQGGERLIPEETPVALVHDASTTAVMMATPADLEDLAVGFTLTEGLAEGPAAIEAVEVVEGEFGIEARVWLKREAGAVLAKRRRQITGPTGCGLCGVDSLAQAARTPPKVGDRVRLTESDVRAALTALEPAQVLGAATRAAHAAGWWTPAEGLVMVREDVGRHNALDKLVGALLRRGPADAGVLVLTSRVSVEMVQKAAVLGAEVLAAISVPTALAVRTAEAAGMTLIAVARQDSFEVFTEPYRLTPM
jgi:FdhD protein